jgi:hypothetical protein
MSRACACLQGFLIYRFYRESLPITSEGEPWRCSAEEPLVDCSPALALVVVTAGNAIVNDGVPLCRMGASLVARLIGSGRA